MKKPFFIVAWLTFPAIAGVAYAFALGLAPAAYFASVSTGIVAYLLACGQFVLAGRPGFVVRILGLPTLLALHGSMGPLMVATAFVHRALKLSAGFEPTTAQAILGLAAALTFLAAAIAGAALLAKPPKPLRPALERLRAFAAGKLGTDRKRARLLHGTSAFAALAILVHALMASTSDPAFNLTGAAALGMALVASLAVYAVYLAKRRRNAA